MQRKILHVDMNNFYASVELLDKPELRNKPVIVGGDESSRHGIVLAKNEVAKKYGIKTAETLYQARKKCPNLVALPSHHDLYREYSRKAKAIYLEYSDKVQSFGPDEAWIDVTHRPESGLELAETIQNRILKELGLTVSVGVSWNKTFAKMGSDYKKPFAITVIDESNYQEILWPLPVESFLFVGSKTAERLKIIGINTIGELAKVDPVYISKYLGKHGMSLVKNARGEDEDPVLSQAEQGPAKSIGAMRTTSKDLSKPEEISKLFSLLADEVEARLATENMRTRTLRIYVRDNKFNNYTRQKALERAISNKAELEKAALSLFKEHFQDIGTIRLLGITADKLEDKNQPQQMDLEDLMLVESDIEENKKVTSKEIEILLNELKFKFGEASVFLANDLNESYELKGSDDLDDFCDK